MADNKLTQGPAIIYEDNHLLVACKPPGWLAQADGGPRPDILGWCRSYLKEKGQKPGKAYAGLCHRLDLAVGGVMALAKTSKAAGRIGRQFRERKIEKIYWALASGRLKEESGSLEQLLVREGRLTRAASGPEGGTRAALRFRVLGKGRLRGGHPVSFLEVELLTGFKHQIRAQMAILGHPILGDGLYGGPVGPPGEESIGLFAKRLSLCHPVSQEWRTFEAWPGPAWPWGFTEREDGLELIPHGP